ncbi:hypothetical protein [Kitasatospora sp. NBC_01539]|uniref:hypothetical protein n=1 Tax=Kitasatospora sp. NBC_01539 TaxID=2903577 RepID=UPI00386010DD
MSRVVPRPGGPQTRPGRAVGNTRNSAPVGRRTHLHDAPGADDETVPRIDSPAPYAAFGADRTRLMS